MSRTFREIPRRIEFDMVRHVTLNKGGQWIGDIVRWRGRLAYLSWRRHQSAGAKGNGHYLINIRGFAVDRALLNSMIRDDKISLIIIKYQGPKGLRYFISSIDDWLMNGRPIGYVKDLGDIVESYQSQMALCEDYMDELEVRI